MNDKDQKIKKMGNERDELQRALAEMRAREAEQQKRLQEFTDLTQRFKKLIDAGTLSVRIVDGKMVVSLGSDVLFPSGSAKLSAKGQETITTVGTQLAAIPDKKYQVEGHTDNVPLKSPQYTNWELASARALSVLKSMIQNGMPADRVSAASFADTAPVAPNDTAENRARNRRIEIVVVPDLSSLPGYEELQKYSNEKQAGSTGSAEKTEATPAKKTEPAKKPDAKPAQ
jgi:chemotaxis protein MotB